MEKSPSAGSEIESSVQGWEWLRLGFGAVIAAQSMVFGLAVSLSPPEGAARWVLHGILAGGSVLVFVLVGLPIAREAWRAAVSGRIVLEQLFLAGIVGAFVASAQSTLSGSGGVFYEVVSVLVAIYTFGRLMGARRRDAALASAERLTREFATAARLTCCGSESVVPVAEIKAGDRVVIRPGDGVPVDGVVESGTAFVREAALTGEPFPVVKRPGDAVVAGGHVLDALLTVRSTAGGGSRRLDSLIAAVREAQSQPGNLQREADRLVGWFLPLVLVVSGATFTVWAVHSGWVVGLFHAMAVLLVACPCAMGLATPIAVWSSLGTLARRGIVSRSGEFLERLAGIDTVVFDKTGTLSEESLAVIDFVTAENVDRSKLKEQIAAVQSASNHPVARAFRGWNAATTEADRVELLPGAGLEAQFPDGSTLRIGNATVLPDGVSVPDALRTAANPRSVFTHEIFVVRNGVPVGIALLREQLRESATEAIDALRAMGLQVHVMTGDSNASAAASGLSFAQGGLTPEDKARLVENLQTNGHRVVFIGDGINDSLAMSRSHTSIAMARGAAMAVESAEARATDPNLLTIVDAIRLCRDAVAAVRGNILFAFVYNVIGMGVAAAGLLHPVAAALIMLAASLTVTWRALRFSEKVQAGPLARTAAPTKAPGVFRREQFLPAAIGSAIALQGPAIVYMGALTGPFAGMLCAAFGGAGLAAWLLLSGARRNGFAWMAGSMFAIGNPAMLAGWWVDNGLMAAVSDGMCLCACVNSTLGWGVVGMWNWMAAGMVAASVPMLVLPVPDFLQRSAGWRWLEWAGCVAGMLLGMQGGALVMAQFQVADPHLHFLLTFATMSLCMIGGMLAACCGIRKPWRTAP